MSGCDRSIRMNLTANRSDYLAEAPSRVPIVRREVMAGLYDGVEEIPFKKIDGGYVFQANNPWFFGPKQRFFVTETQKAEIAACLKETLQRIKPWVFVAMVVIPLLLVAGTFCVALNGGMLDVTLTDASGRSTTTTQSIGLTGSTGTIAGVAGRTVLFKVSGGPPGKDSTITYTPVDASGKASAPTIVPLCRGGSRLNVADDKGHIVNSAVFVGRNGTTSGSIMLDTMLLALALFTPYVGAIHIYSMKRLRPLIAELPRTDSKISFGEGTAHFATKMPSKLFNLMVGAGAMGFLANAMVLTDGLLENRPITSMGMPLFGLGMSGLATAYFTYLIVLRMRAKRNAA
jgi:hypothetical protein